MRVRIPPRTRSRGGKRQTRSAQTRVPARACGSESHREHARKANRPGVGAVSKTAGPGDRLGVRTSVFRSWGAMFLGGDRSLQDPCDGFDPRALHSSAPQSGPLRNVAQQVELSVRDRVVGRSSRPVPTLTSPPTRHSVRGGRV